MFEQVSIESSRLLRRPWAMGLSVLGQSAILGVAALLSLWQTGSLPRVSLVTGVVPPGRRVVQNEPPRAMERFSGPRAAEHVFTMPASIPTGVRHFVDLAPEAPPIDGGGADGIVGGIDALAPLGHPLVIGQPRPVELPSQAK